MGADGKKLSKRHGATSVEEYKAQGLFARHHGELPGALGWSLDGETTIISRDMLCEKFSLDRITKGRRVFDETKLEWMNGQYIKAMNPAQWVEFSRPWPIEAGATAEDIDARPEWYAKLLPAARRARNQPDRRCGKAALHVLGRNVTLDEKSVNKVLKKEGARADEAPARNAAISWPTKAAPGNARACSRHAAICASPWRHRSRKTCSSLCAWPCAATWFPPPLFESIELMERADVLARIDATMNEVFAS